MTTLYGGGSGSPYLKRCPSGSYIAEISGSHTDSTVTQLCGKCSDGTVLPCVGKEGPKKFAKAGPLYNVDVRTGSDVDNILGHGGGGGVAHNIVCSPGSYVDAYEGRSDDWIRAVGFQCGYTRPPADSSGAYGGLAGVGFSKQCPNGTYLSEISGSNSTDRFTQMCGKCSDGTVLPCVGKEGSIKFKENGPFTNIKLKTGDWVDNLMGHGGMGGGDRVITCPEGTYANSYSGRGGEWIDAIGFQCGYTKPANNQTNTQTPANNQTNTQTPANNQTAGIGGGGNSSGGSTSSFPTWAIILIVGLIVLAIAVSLIWRKYSNNKSNNQRDKEFQHKQFALLQERQFRNPMPNNYLQPQFQPQFQPQVQPQVQPQY